MKNARLQQTRASCTAKQPLPARLEIDTWTIGKEWSQDMHALNAERKLSSTQGSSDLLLGMPLTR